jgi:hypothetical protein
MRKIEEFRASLAADHRTCGETCSRIAVVRMVEDIERMHANQPPLLSAEEIMEFRDRSRPLCTEGCVWSERAFQATFAFRDALRQTGQKHAS